MYAINEGIIAVLFGGLFCFFIYWQATSDSREKAFEARIDQAFAPYPDLQWAQIQLERCRKTGPSFRAPPPPPMPDGELVTRCQSEVLKSERALKPESGNRLIDIFRSMR